MVNTASAPTPHLTGITVLVRSYLAITIATLVVLGLLSATAPRQAPGDAWIHSIIVAIFAVVLLLRARSAQQGSVRALRAVGIISAVLLLANVVLVLIPGFLPIWMRVEMVIVAVLMAVNILLVARERV